jgi:ubiquinone/menaquinone biosynthesis C-methylase UbiE
MADAHWQLDGSAPELYQRYLVPAITMKWADDLVSRAKPRAAEVVLDLACGTGVVARLAAKQMERGRVVGLDLNAGMLAIARTEPRDGAPIKWIEGSALDLPFSSGSFDVALCQLGLRFFPDQGRALLEMRRVLSKTGRIALSAYSPIEHTPGAHAFVLALDHVLGAGSSKIKRDEHSFPSSTQLKNHLVEADFIGINVQIVEQQIAFPSVLDYVRFQLLATPMAALLKGRTGADRLSIIAKIASETASFAQPPMFSSDRFAFPQEAYVATARNTD